MQRLEVSGAVRLIYAEDFFRPKNPTVSAGFEPANLGTKGLK